MEGGAAAAGSLHPVVPDADPHKDSAMPENNTPPDGTESMNAAQPGGAPGPAAKPLAVEVPILASSPRPTDSAKQTDSDAAPLAGGDGCMPNKPAGAIARARLG
jgi:hypothetical protein